MKLLGMAFLLVAVVGLGLTVKAFSSENSPQVVVEGDWTGSIAGQNQADNGEELGSVSSPDISSPYLSVNGDTTYYVGGTFADATTTIISIANPFLKATSSAADVVLSGTYPNGYTGATSTVEMVRLYVDTAATSTFTVACGAASTPFATPTYNILSSDAMATSSVGVIENNLATAVNAGVGGGTVAKIMLTPTLPYLNCKVTTAYAGAFTEASNTFAGRIRARISRSNY